MTLPDVNVLIAAFRQDHPHHSLCRPWLDQTIKQAAWFGIAPLTLSAVIRVTTGSRFALMPSTLEEAFGFCEDLIRLPRCRLLAPGEQHWAIFKQVCADSQTIGSRVTDAWFAALAIEWGCEWITLDRDYARFPGLKWSLPVAA